jgi:glycosyltransferase involved in cell wall biosynthesis
LIACYGISESPEEDVPVVYDFIFRRWIQIRVNMRVLFITASTHLPELRGGMEINTHQLSRSLIGCGTAVGVLCGLHGVGLIGISARIRRKLLRDPCPVDNWLGYPTWRSYEPIAHIPSVVSVFKPDAIVVQGAADFPLVTECLARGLPVVCYLHIPDRLLLDDRVLSHPNLTFVANSQFTKSLHPEKTFAGVIPPLVPSELYTTTTDRSSALFINPAPYKGLQIVLALATARPDVRFLFVVNRRGFKIEDTYKEPLRRLQNVKLLGPVRDMRKVYCKAKLVLAPSQILETWGRIATEVHFSGVPVLASDRGGLPESVGPGGLCIPVDAPVSVWLEAFSRIWDDPVYYGQLCKAALQYSQRREISQDAIVASFLGLLTSRRGGQKGCQHAKSVA